MRTNLPTAVYVNEVKILVRCNLDSKFPSCAIREFLLRRLYDRFFSCENVVAEKLQASIQTA